MPKHAFTLLKYALYSWGHMTKFFLENFCIMGYNLKNARNNKSASKYQDGQGWDASN